MHFNKIDKTLLGYIFRGSIAFLVWFFFYSYILQPMGFDSWMNEFVAKGGHFLVGLFGYNSCIEGTSICVNIVSTVHIASGCNGFDIFSVFVCFIIIFEGKWWHKVLYCSIGILILHFFNITRVALLAIDHYENLKLFQFNHKYTYLIIMYFVVFMMWVLWIIKFSKKKNVNPA